MNDKLGMPLFIGDRVIYTTGEQSNQTLEIGTILDFRTAKYSSSSKTSAQLLSANGRKLTKLRASYELVSVEPIYKAYPEILI